MLLSSISTGWASSPNQMVSSVPSTINAYTGQCFDIDLLYSVSNNYTNLNGIGISIHYDTNYFASPTLMYSSTGASIPYIAEESINDDDGDSATDKTISIAWFDQSTNWPGESLPITLCTLRLTVLNDLTIGNQSIIHVTPTSTHLGYGFSSEPSTVTIADPDQGPVISQEIVDIVVNEDAMSQSIDLSPVFTDIDNDDAQIVISVQSNSNPTLISATINSNWLNLTFMENQYGNAEIVIIAFSNGKSISDTFTITVNTVDDPPFVANAISDITMNEDDPNKTINLINVFSDIDDTQITKTILTNSNSTLISASIVENTLTIEFLENQNGEANLTINAESNGQSISDTFTITVNAVDDPPTIATPIADVTENEDAANKTIDLTNVFSDIDNTQITKTILTNSNSTLISASIVENTLTIEFLENQNGEANLTINAESNGQNISDTFKVTVNAVNDPPLISTILDQEVKDTSVAISYTINDIETAPENLSVTLQSSSFDILPVLSDHILMTGSGSSRSIMLTPVEGAYGACMLTLVVMDVSTNSSTSFAFENIQPIFSIVTLANGSGTISPTGTIQILKGNNATFSIVPSTGNRVDDLLINGNSVGAQSQYTFWSVAQNYTIQAIFSPIPTPVADFYAEPLSGDVPLIVDFVNTSQNEFTSVQWLFGDNSKSSATSPVHTYALPGQYTVCLQLTGPGGKHTLTKTAYIQVNETCDLSIQFYANNRTVAIQTDIQMTGIVSDSSASLAWDFGDGTSSQERNPIHAYATPGIYNVGLTAVSSANNCSATTIKSEYIQVVGRKITGQVRANGNAVANCLMSLWYNESRMLDFALTNENGDYTFNNLPAKAGFVLSVMPPSSMRDLYNTQYYPEAILFSEAERISTQFQDLHLEIDLIAPPDNGIHGQIFMDSQGVADAQVTIFSQSLDHARTVVTDGQGNYTITKLPLADDYVLNAFIDSINQEYYYAIPKDETPGEYIPQSSVTRMTRATQIEPGIPWLQHIDIIMQNAKISGTVISDGQPVSNVLVYAWSDAVNCNNFCATNVNGQYTITGLIAVSDTEAPTKGYIVELQSAGFPYQVFDKQTDIDQATRVATGHQNIDFQLYSGRKVSGCVTDINHLPLSGAFIQIESDNSDTRAQTYSDNNGNYTFTNLPVASDYYIFAFVQNYPLQYYLNADNRDEAQAINLFDDHATNINFIMDKGGVIKGLVSMLESAQPVGEGTWVNIWSENTRSGGDVPTDSNGYYEITGLDFDADDYIISIWDENYVNVFYSSSGSVYQYSEATSVAPSDDNRNLTLTPGYCIQGKITYQDAPVDGIQIWADGPTTGTAISESAFVSNANYEICGLSPGSFEVSMSSDQYLDKTYTENIIITDSNQTDINFELELPTRILAGTIYHADINETVRLYASSTDCQEHIRITGTGEPVAFTFSNLRPASDYLLEIRPDNHDYQVYNNKTVLTQGNFIDLSTNNVNGIEITLTRSSGEIKGVIEFPDPLIINNSVWLTAFFNQNQQVSVEVFPGSGESVPYTLTGIGLVTDCEVRLTSEYYEQQVKIINTNDSQPDNSLNFILTPGGSIAGQIRNANSDGISGANVMVWSDQLQMGGTTQTDRVGNYQIGGLNSASDYDVSVQDDTTTFYYHQAGTVVQASKKGTVSLNQGQSITEIDIQMFEGEKIEGTVRNINGVPLANVYISVELGQDAAGSSTTNQQGKYRVDNLQAALNYIVTAIPNSDTGYIKQVKNNVQSNSLQVDYILQQGYSLSGNIMRWDQTPVANAEIEICTISMDTFPMPVFSDNQGHYEIKGLPGASDYFLQVTPPAESNLSTYKNQNLMIDDHTIHHVTLSSALSISGTIMISGTGEAHAYTQSARINIYANNGFNEFAESNSDGTFILNHVPDTTDYTITVYADGYVDQSIYQVFAGETVNITLSAAKQVYGFVKDSRGVAITGARVELISDMMNISSEITLDDGSFVFEGIPEYFNGILIDDYRLVVTACGYPDLQKNNIALDTSISIVLDADASLFLEGSVTDFDSNPLPDGYAVNVRLYEQNRNSNNVHMKIKKALNHDGTFKFTGLDANKTYMLKFKQFDNKGSVKLQEYAGENNVGVDKKQNAIFYSPGETVNFRFSEVWH